MKCRCRLCRLGPSWWQDTDPGWATAPKATQEDMLCDDCRRTETCIETNARYGTVPITAEELREVIR